MKVAIVDDDAMSIKRLTQYVITYGQENGIEFKCVSFVNPVQFLEGYDAGYDLIFMDIKMDMMNGISVCRRIRKIDEAVCIVFITGFTQYALNGYEVSAFDYIVKPIGYGNFCLKMSRIIKFISKNKKKNYITLKLKSGYEQIDVSDIIYVEVRGHNIEYRLADRRIILRGSLKKAEEALNQFYFARCSEYFLLNLEKVLSIKNGEVFIGKEQFKIGRAYKADFMSKFEDYVLRRK